MTPWEEYKKSSFSRIQELVTANVSRSSLKAQIQENKHITALYLSQLAYFSFDKMRQKLTEFGATRMSFYDHNGTQGYFAEFDNLAIVSFRGTQMDQREDLKNAFTFWKKDFNGIKVHKGFVSSLESLVPNVKADLAKISKDKHVIFVGHSMGGALSTLLTIVHKPDELCTFGAPRVAGRDLVAHLEGVEYNRLITSYDLVRLLPPSIPFFVNYAHSGTPKTLPSKWSWKHFLRPHLLVSYLNALLDEDT